MRLASDITHQRPGVLLLRFTVAGLMLFHGVAKLRSGLGPIEGLLSGAGLPTWFAYGVLVGEIVAPLMILAGVLVRVAALVVAFNMIVAVALAHSTDLLSLSRSGGYGLELQAFYFFGALSIAMLAGARSRA
jgi:putative oxidoreductase